MRRHFKQHIQGCSTSARHWFTLHASKGGGPGAICAVCKHACGAIHPDIIKALQAGLLYANLYAPAEGEDFDRNLRELDRHRRLIARAIERIGNERKP